MVTCPAYNWFAPWELAYRQQGASVEATQLAALPAIMDAHLERTDTYSRDRILTVESYASEGECDRVLAYYRQLIPTRGWKFELRQQMSTDTNDTYSGAFSGYALTLHVDCDKGAFSLSASVAPLHEFWLVGHLFGPH
jgi:hypothetical protein